jgi:hypothetical protein
MITDLRNGYIEVQAEFEDGPTEEEDEYRKSSILEIRHGDFHTPEFDSPTNRRFRGRWFET